MRLTASIWAFFYLFSAVGYGAEVHYCLGQVSEVSYIWFDASCACDAAGDQLKRDFNCCEDERFFVQLEDEHQSSGSTEISADLVHMKLDFNLVELVPIELEVPIYLSDRAPPSTKERLISIHRLVFYA